MLQSSQAYFFPLRKEKKHTIKNRTIQDICAFCTIYSIELTSYLERKMIGGLGTKETPESLTTSHVTNGFSIDDGNSKGKILRPMC